MSDRTLRLISGFGVGWVGALTWAIIDIGSEGQNESRKGG